MISYATILIGATSNVANAVCRRTRFHANRQGCSCCHDIYGRYDVSAIKPSWNLREFDSACSMLTACAKYDDLAMSTRAEVEKALAGIDMRVSFRCALSFSILPPTLYVPVHIQT